MKSWKPNIRLGAVVLAVVAAVVITLEAQTNAGFFSKLFLGSSNVIVQTGTATPEAAVSGSVGDLFLQTDGAGGKVLWVKQSGAATTTGWDTAAGTLVTTTITTTGNIDNLALSGADVLRVNNATLATIRGIVAPAAGDPERVTIVSVGAGQVNLAHQNAGSTAANRLINFATVGDTPLAAGTGVAVIEYDATTQRWRLVQHEQGAWITPAFAAGDYTGSGAQTVTLTSGDVTTCAFRLSGRTLTVSLVLSGITVGGTPSTDIQRAIPNGFVSLQEHRGAVYRVSDNGTVGQGIAIVEAAGTKIRILKIDISNWTASTDNTTIQGQVSFDVQ